ncbi:MAG TPA: alpha-2-macroglobulin family protein, partial [Planctomycetota bacterium]|nr:alpha-2-macroglobulin family protein [Planctomycetota bacterium]
GRIDPLPTLVSNPYVDRMHDTQRFIERWNEVISGIFMTGLLFSVGMMSLWVLVYLLRRLAEARFSGLTVLLIVVGMGILMVFVFAPGKLSSQRASSAKYRDPAVMAMPVEEPPPAPRTVWMDELVSKPAEEMARPTPQPAASAPARIREYFPETLYWQPQLITDEHGRARVTLPAADSITTWRLMANAVTRNGALGYEQANLKVFQDFFVDIDFPVALTKGDRVEVPVAVYNYLREPQTVSLRIQRDSWFEALDDETKSVSLKPGEVSAVYFGLKVKEHGRKTLTVFADGKVQDAIRRSVEVFEKGREIPLSVSDRVSGRRAIQVEIPKRAIDGASVLFVRLTPGVSDLVTGLEGMIRMPTGCFEQTLSSAYPNVAIHTYLKETGQLTKDAEDRLRQAHSIAVQKILSFENPSGGFGWYPGREANLVLTAYGTMFLGDLAKVYDFDRRVLDRAIAWLEARQDPSGSWAGHDHGSTWSRLSNSATPSTAWVAWALKRAGRTSPAVGRAEEFLRRFDEDDGYAAALIANAFPSKRNLDQLARMGKEGRWTTRVQTWTRAR